MTIKIAENVWISLEDTQYAILHDAVLVFSVAEFASWATKSAFFQVLISAWNSLIGLYAMACATYITFEVDIINYTVHQSNKNRKGS